MPNDILITPGSASVAFSGSAANTIKLQVEPSGSVAFYGNSGSLFSIVDSLEGSLMSVNDVSGIPILEVFSDDRVVMGTFGQNTLVVTGSSVGIGTATPSATLDVSGSINATGGITGSWGNKYTQLIGNNTASSFTVTHNLNNTNIMAQVVREASGSFVYPDITISGSNAITVAFSTIPSSSEYRVNVVGF
jgi:hypothetical protein